MIYRYPRFTLLYGGEVLSFSDDGDVLLYEKAELIFKRAVRYPELLEIYFQGFPWIFDKQFDYKLASCYLVWCKLGYPLAVKEYIKLQNNGVICY